MLIARRELLAGLAAASATSALTDFSRFAWSILLVRLALNLNLLRAKSYFAPKYRIPPMSNTCRILSNAV